MKKIISIILSFIFIFCVLATVPVMATSDIDITSSTVRADLASMGEDKLSYVSDSYCIFIAMSQYYDLQGNLRSYLYFNLPSWAAKYQDGLCVSISTAVSDANYNITESFANYDLQFVNKDSTWYKYEILGLPNVEQTTRRYNIAEIIAKDAETSLNFYVDETYIFHGIENDSIEVFNQEVETITITENEVSFFCYGEDSAFGKFFGEYDLMAYGNTYTDAWYIFFNTDKKIDNLLEVEITYKQYDYHLSYGGQVSMATPFTESEILDKVDGIQMDDDKDSISYHEQAITTVLPGTKRVSASNNFWGGYATKYEDIDNIMDLRTYDETDAEGHDFVFTEQAKKYTWGVNFLTTSKKCTQDGSISCDVDGSGVSNTAILRLKFEINGIVKNCYAIDTPSDDFTGNSATTDIESKFEVMFERLIMIIGVFMLIVLIGYCLPVFKFVFEGVAAVISFPFKLISRLFFGKK